MLNINIIAITAQKVTMKRRGGTSLAVISAKATVTPNWIAARAVSSGTGDQKADMSASNGSSQGTTPSAPRDLAAKDPFCKQYAAQRNNERPMKAGPSQLFTARAQTVMNTSQVFGCSNTGRELGIIAGIAWKEWRLMEYPVNTGCH